MMKIKSYNYKIDEDTIFIDHCKSENGWIFAGDVKINGKYKILLLKMNKNGKELWKKIYGGGYEYEAQTIIRENDRCIIGGNAYGRATENGGHGWKGYILSVDENGEKLGDMIYNFGNNDIIYSIVNRGDELWAMGETRNEEHGIFTMRINKKFQLVETKKYKKYDDVVAGGITSKFLSYSYKHLNKWFARIIRVDEKLDEIWERDIPDLIIYSAKEMDGSVLIVGAIDNMGIALKIDEHGKKEVRFRDGVILSAEIWKDRVILAGEHDKKPVLYILNENLEIIDMFVDCFVGWYEKAFFTDANNIIALGYILSEKMGIISVINRG